MVKHTILAAIAFFILISLAGCEFVPTDVSELMSPPKLTAEQQKIEQALEKAVGGKLSLKYPITGEYRSAFIMHDFDNDGNNEALAFYSTANGNGGTHIAVLKKIKSGWISVGDISGDGTDIDSIEFGDFTGSGSDDLAVCWRSFNSTDMTLCVYSNICRKRKKVGLGIINLMKKIDMDGDGRPDLLVLRLNTDESKAYARLFSYRGGVFGEVAQAPLDGTVTGYSGLYLTKIPGQTGEGVLIDGNKGDHSMVTELVYFKDNRLITPFYNPSDGTAAITFRSQPYPSMDINNDGIVDIPIPEQLPAADKNGKNVYLCRWSDFDGNSGLVPKLYCAMNYSENYYFEFPQKWLSENVTIRQDGSGSAWDFVEWDASKKQYGTGLFKISVMDDTAWDSMAAKLGLYKLAEKNGFVYSLEIKAQNTADPLVLSIDEIKKAFFLLN